MVGGSRRDGTGSTALALVQSVALSVVNGVHANGKAGSGAHGIDARARAR
jgi:hypothetical protein